MAMELNNNNGINNLTSQMTKLTTHPTEMQVMRFHGRMGSQLTASEKQLINKHLDIIQLVQDGEACLSTTGAQHPELIAEGAKRYGPSLWQKSAQGDSARADMKQQLESMFPGSSNNIMLWTGDRNWEFSNKSQSVELMTLQNVGNAYASNATQHMKETFTLVDLAEKVGTDQLPTKNGMNINSNNGPPLRKKIIIIACKGGGAGESKGGGRRKKYTRKRKQKRKRRKSRKIKKRRKTKKRQRKRRK